MLLTKDQILSAQDRKFLEVDVPEWGGKARLGALMTASLLRFRDLSEEARQGQNREKEILLCVLAGSLVDATGEPIFTEAEIPKLLLKNPEPVLRLFIEALKLNGLDVEKLKAKQAEGVGSPVEEARGNS